MSQASSKVPQQARSRAALERVITAATQLFIENGEGLRLKDVAERAGVAVGSIYSRFDGKEDVIAAVIRREMSRMAADTRKRLNIDSVREHAGLDERVPWLVDEAGSLLADNAEVLRSAMASAETGSYVHQSGKEAFTELENAFVDRLIDFVKEFTHREPRKAARWAFTLFYSVTARYLGLGSSLESAHEGDWQSHLDNLSITITRYLNGKDRA
jgi:AcrR family transcriptional regulator